MKTRLFKAIEKQDAKEVEACLKKGADLTETYEGGCKPLSYASQVGYWELVLLMLNNPTPRKTKVDMHYNDVLLHASKADQNGIAMKLINDGVACDAHFIANGYDAFHYAAQKGNVPILKLLLEKKVNPSHKTYFTKENQNQTTALHIAVEFNQLEAIVLLMNANADQSLTDMNGQTPLESAAVLGHWDCVTTILSHGKCFPYSPVIYEKIVSYATHNLKITDKKKYDEIISLLIKKSPSLLESPQLRDDALGKTIHDSYKILHSALQYKTTNLEEFKRKTVLDAKKMSYFHDAKSLDDACRKLDDFIKKHSESEALCYITLANHDTSLFKLAYLKHKKMITKDQKDYSQHITDYFVGLPKEAHAFIAQAMLDILFSSKINFSAETQLEINALSYKKYTPQIKVSVYLKGLPKLKEKEMELVSVLTEERYCFDPMNMNHKLFVRAIAALKYIAQRHFTFNNEKVLKTSVIELFGKDVFLKGAWYERNYIKKYSWKTMRDLNKYRKLHPSTKPLSVQTEPLWDNDISVPSMLSSGPVSPVSMFSSKKDLFSKDPPSPSSKASCPH